MFEPSEKTKEHLQKRLDFAHRKIELLEKVAEGLDRRNKELLNRLLTVEANQSRFVTQVEFAEHLKAGHTTTETENQRRFTLKQLGYVIGGLLLAVLPKVIAFIIHLFS